jgi:8-amino-3,8-dideoxy-alpha-D-manno-octulosonate transaminase
VVGGQRNNIPADEILPGINFRMPELLGAVALVQLRRLRGLLEDMRARKRFLKGVLAEIAPQRGLQFRVQNDPEGDAAIALIFYLPDPGEARQVSQALAAEGLDNFVMYSPDAVDYHVYAHWAPILNQRAWTPGGGPWVNHPRRVTYHREMCPRTLDLLSRAVHVDVSPELSSTQLEEMAAAFYKVLS